VSHEVLEELAREALAEYHAGQTLDAAYADMAADDAREAESAEWPDALIGDVADEPDELRPPAEE
jgi:hypothetical protein